MPAFEAIAELKIYLNISLSNVAPFNAEQGAGVQADDELQLVLCIIERNEASHVSI